MHDPTIQRHQVFDGTVTAVVLLSQFAGHAFQVATFNAAYVVTIDVTHTDDQDGLVEVGQRSFIVHSPMYTLHIPQADAVGCTVRLDLTYEVQGDKTRLVHLQPASAQTADS